MSLEQNSPRVQKRRSKVVSGTIVMCALASLATACSNDDKDAASTSVPKSQSSADTKASSSEATDATVPPSESSASNSSTGASSSSAAAPSQATIEGARLWESSDGSTSMEVSPDWTETPFAGALGAFKVGEPSDGFQSNVNMVSEAVDMSVEQYVEVSIANSGAFGTFDVLDSGTKEGPYGSEIGWIEYQGYVNSAPNVELHFLGVMNSANGHVSTTTFAATVDQFADLVGDVRPYLETIQAH